MHTVRNPKRQSLLVFADDWGRHPSSCQHLIRRLMNDYDVLWVNSVGTRRVRFNLFTLRRGIEKLKNWKKGLQKGSDKISVVDLPMLPFSNAVARSINRKIATAQLLRTMRKLNLQNPIVITTLPYISDLISSVPRSALAYYCTDDYSHWPDADGQAMRDAEMHTLRDANMVLAVSETLVNRFASHTNCRYFPHGVEIKHFAAVQSAAAAEEIERLPGPKIGFFGLIYEKLNFELLAAVANKFHSGSLVLIGPESYCPDSFRKLPNVHLFGPKPYAELPRWIAALDVLLLPYVDDAMIRQSNPLKLRECLATGKPTVSIDIPEVRQYLPWLRIGATVDEYVSAVGDALAEKKDSHAVEARQNLVRSDDWDDRAATLRNWLSELTAANSHSFAG